MTFAADYARISQLIATGQAREARLALVSILYRNSMDPRAWWLYAQVAENEKQLYHILRALLDLPTNAYTAKARLALAKLSYRPQEDQTKKPQEVRAQPKKASPRRYPFKLSTALIALGVLVAVFLGIATLGMITAGSSVTASASVQFIMPTEANQGVVQIVTLQPEATSTPRPTVTPYPTRTPRPPATTVPPAATATPVYPKAADVLPPLNQLVADESAELFKAEDTVAKAFSASSELSVKAVQTGVEQADQIRKLRNKVAWLNLSQVAPDARQQAVLPAHTAFTDYANSLLQWIDLEIQAYQAYSMMGQAALTDLATSRQLWLEQSAQVDKQADLVKAKRAALQDKLLDYKVFTEQAILAAQVSSRAAFLTSRSTPAVHLAAGKYRVAYRWGVPGAAKGTISISAVDGSTPEVKIIDNAAQPAPDGQIIEFKEGDYSINAKSMDWWVIAFDPAN